MDLYQQIIHKTRYARYLPELQRREHWHETGERYVNYAMGKFPGAIAPVKDELLRAITNLECMPSMRALWTAGPALDADNMCGYNCAYASIDSIEAFADLLYILMCGTGRGFSCELEEVRKLPPVPTNLEKVDRTIVVEDSRAGWRTAYLEWLNYLWAGYIPNVDVSKVRPKGAVLKTIGGRASGPQPLLDLFEHTIVILKGRLGTRLRPIDVHSICTKSGEVVIVGAMRRSALISLSDLNDADMAVAKSGKWWEINPHFQLANNSAVYQGKPSRAAFDREWGFLAESGSGERGIFNLEAARRQAALAGRDGSQIKGLNPCAEILLRNNQLCNLSTSVMRKDISWAEVKRRVRLGAIFGTFQAALTDFKHISNKWKQTTEEERLIGVSLSGICDAPLVRDSTPEMLQELQQVVRDTNKEWAPKFGIKPTNGLTCVKPDGNSSQLLNTSSGIHTRHSPYYIRRIRQSVQDPITQFLMERGAQWEYASGDEGTVVFEFPQRAPEGSKTLSSENAFDQLNRWMKFKNNWTNHTVSATIGVREEEWGPVGEWVYENFDSITGISFLPYSGPDGGGHTYKQAPYEACTEATYRDLLSNTPKSIDWSELVEGQDVTEGAKNLACVGGSCEV